jgi:hypothetical protein
MDREILDRELFEHPRRAKRGAKYSLSLSLATLAIFVIPLGVLAVRLDVPQGIQAKAVAAFSSVKETVEGGTSRIAALSDSISYSRSVQTAQAASADSDSITGRIGGWLCRIFGGCKDETPEEIPVQAQNFQCTPTQPVQPALVPVAQRKSATTTIVNQYITQPVVERTVEHGSGNVTGVDEATLNSKLSILKNDLLSRISQSSGGGGGYTPVYVNAPSGDYVTRDLFTKQTDAIFNSMALMSRIDQLSGTKLSKITIDGVSGLTDADIPDGITASNYLPLAGGTLSGDLAITGNFTVSGAQTLSGAITIPYLTATSTTVSSFIQASSTRLSIFDKAYFGGSATSTFDSAGNLSVAGTLGVTGATTLGNFTGTNGTTTNATSTNLYTSILYAPTASTTNLTFTNATGTSATTTNFFSTNASSTNLHTSNLFVASLSGFLKATAGAVATALIDLANDVTGILPVGNGGTGWAAIQAGTIPYGNGAGALATTSAGTAGYVLSYLNGIPTWTATTTLSTISGTLAAGSGGTGQSTWTKGDLLYSDNTNSLAKLGIGTGGYVLGSLNGIPTWVATDTLSTITGTLAVGKGGTGQTSFGQGWLNSDGTTLSASTSPTVNYIVATSTTATSTFAGGLSVGNSAALVINQAASANSLYINPSGNVGVGTAAPNTKLYVQGNTQLNGNVAIGGTAIDSNTGLTTSLNITDPAAANNGANFSRTLSLTTSGSQIITGGQFTVAASANAFNQTGILRGGSFTTSSSNTATVSNAYGIDSLLYNVGAGTITTGAAENLTIQNLNASGVISNAYGSKAAIAFNLGTITNTYGYYVGDITTGTQTNTPYSFYASDSGANNYFAGKVGIGTTSPWRTLSVTGTVGFDGLTAGAGAGSLCLTANKEVVYSDNAGCTGSSLRFKHDIATLDTTSGIEEAMKLRPVSFVYNDDIGVKGEQVGFIAEDVAGVDTRLITYDASGTPNNVKYTNMVAIAIKAIQDVWMAVLDLKDKVAGFAEKLVTKELVATNGDFDNIHIKNELCIGATCLTETQVQALLNQTGQQAAVAATQVQSTAAPESTSTPETETASTTPATDSAGSPQASESVEQENSASTTESQPSADAEALSTEGATKSSTTQTPDNN